MKGRKCSHNYSLELARKKSCVTAKYIIITFELQINLKITCQYINACIMLRCHLEPKLWKKTLLLAMNLG